jgi:hypothetical protein
MVQVNGKRFKASKVCLDCNILDWQYAECTSYLWLFKYNYILFFPFSLTPVEEDRQPNVIILTKVWHPLLIVQYLWTSIYILMSLAMPILIKYA